MKNQDVYTVIEQILGATFARKYKDSAPFFNAQIETSCKGGYFIESRQFVNSLGERGKRSYHLKCITRDSLSELKTFGCKKTAMNAFNNLEFRDNNSVIIERYYVQSHNHFLDQCSMHCVSTMIYDNGYTALYVDPLYSLLWSYCEGDVVITHCLNSDIYNDEINRYVDFYNKNEGLHYEI